MLTGNQFSTRIKGIINRLLKPIGLQMNTTLAHDIEKARLNKLLQRGHWDTPLFTSGIQIADEYSLDLLQTICLPYQSEYVTFPLTSSDPNKYYLNNIWYTHIDAEILYSMIRYHQPRQIFEVGSGFSTRVIRTAITTGGIDCRLVSIDPQPRSEIDNQSDEHIASLVEDLNKNEFIDRLNANDILFIDSSHQIKTGSDIPFLFLEILPNLRSGVIVHIHDIFLPYDYPKEWVIDEMWGWNEQYLVHAFLSFNNAFKILFPTYYLWRQFPEKVRNIFPNLPANIQPLREPASLWIQKL